MRVCVCMRYVSRILHRLMIVRTVLRAHKMGVNMATTDVVFRFGIYFYHYRHDFLLYMWVPT